MIEAVEVKLVMDIGEPAKGKKKSGIARGRLLEEPFGFPQVLDEIGIIDHAIDDRARFDIRFVSLDVLRRTNLNRCFFLRSKTRLELGHNLLCDLALDRKDIRELPVVMLRPNLGIGRGIEYLGLDANTIVGTLHAAFQKVANAK